MNASGFLIVRVGALRGALPLAHVIETMRPLPTRSVANAPEFVRGISMIRGEPLPVVDLASVLGASAKERTRFVIVRSGERKVALAVEAVDGIRVAAAEALASVPPLLSKAQEGVIAALTALDNELYLVLKTTYLVPNSSVWSAVLELEAK